MEHASRLKMTSMPETSVEVHRPRGFGVPRPTPIVPSQDAPIVPNHEAPLVPSLDAPSPSSEDSFVAPEQGLGYESIGRSALRHPALIGTVAALGLLAGVAIGYEHPAAYSAQAQLMVGRSSSMQEDQVPGLAAGIQALASNYARLITSQDVTAATERALHRSSLPGTLSATPVPQSSVINVIATSPNESQALALANAGAAALTQVVTTDTNDTQAQLQPLLGSYTKAENAFQSATAEANLLQHRLNVLFNQIGNNTPTPLQTAEESALNSEIVAEQTKASFAQLQAGAYSNQYVNALPPLTEQEEMVQQTGGATYTGDNRKSFTEAAGLLGLVGGVVVGLAGAVWADTRRGRRARGLAL